ncbi:chemotaxis-specific protein-glutamate methyltransferase CheB [Chitiniphilus purpureus]|uniref:Protein-glutamate methylesterase/protein-glutamine glutaminase n=1 Tax=Chitiniphilus purpureus TaxID=2981137 RepID=A0ABY6DIH3_9NEIS|nr:chemotaxis-specific protein-glutamate methyltransferase CheB [Chitiniphilus sp. CD1]UXY14145.1 chemotaxis-specific protein-glutamate methyltransferase CheB [Chitiniphilus sp. CD1]
MAEARLRLLIVDDSALMRRELARLFEEDGGFEVLTCADGPSALEALTRFAPDVVTLDVTMPGMDGLTVLSRLMVTRPTPVVMVSAITEHGSLAALEALAMGAVDCVAKPQGSILLGLGHAGAQIVTTVRAAAHARVVRPTPRRPAPPQAPPHRLPPAPPGSNGPTGVVLIGVSTGGPRALEQILPRLPAGFPYPVVICQHMPAAFTHAFAARLDRLCALTVSEVRESCVLEPGHAYVAKGETDLMLLRRDEQLIAQPRPIDPAHYWHPAVEVLVRSALACVPASRIIGVQLTGMGYDGAAALCEVHAQGGLTIAESAESAVIFGMPQALISAGGATVVLPAGAIADQLIAWARRPAPEGKPWP